MRRRVLRCFVLKKAEELSKSTAESKRVEHLRLPMNTRPSSRCSLVSSDVSVGKCSALKSRGRLGCSREGTDWEHVPQTLVRYRLLDPLREKDREPIRQ